LLSIHATHAIGAYAVPYSGRRPLMPVRLLDGVIVEEPMHTQLASGPTRYEEFLGVDSQGPTGGRDPRSLNGDEVLLSYTGVYLLPSGRVAAVYGAKIEALNA
jgi:hypothetical protein